MCTAIHLCNEGLFGRTLDYEKSFGEGVIFTPREFMRMGEARNRYSMLGVGVVKDTSTLYFDGMNEWGLAGAALNFPEYAKYHGAGDKKAEVPSGLLLSFILGFCKNIGEIKGLFRNIGITADSVIDMPSSPLHWIFADKTGTLTVESTDEGVQLIDNPYGVLTNSPDLEYHATRLADYMKLDTGYPENRLTKAPLVTYSRGMGAMGLPGDFSSSSRFIRALFVKENTVSYGGNNEDVGRMMHILSSVSIPRGCIRTEAGEPVSTLYKGVMDIENLVYYFCSYGNPTLRAIRLHPENTDMSVYPLYERENVNFIN